MIGKQFFNQIGNLSGYALTAYIIATYVPSNYQFFGFMILIAVAVLTPIMDLLSSKKEIEQKENELRFAETQTRNKSEMLMDAQNELRRYRILIDACEMELNKLRMKLCAVDRAAGTKHYREFAWFGFDDAGIKRRLWEMSYGSGQSSTKEPPKSQSGKSERPDVTNIRNALRILGLPERATKDEIRAAYRERVKTAHPDHGGNNDALRAVMWAKEILLGD